MSDELLKKIRESVINFEFEALHKALEEGLESGIPPLKIVNEGMAEGVRVVGEKFEAGEYFLLDLIMAGEILEEGLKILNPHLKAGQIQNPGKIVIGTVEGDLHYIGKHVVSTLLKSAGFIVVDIGEDVSPEYFVESVKKEKPDIVGMSALISSAMPQMEATIKALEESGYRKEVKIIVGGAPLNSEYATKIGADAYARDAVDGFKICKGWMEGG